MKVCKWLSVGLALVILAGGASGQERYVPSTVSPEAAELIGVLEPDSLTAGIEDEWKAAWEATEEALHR